LAGLHLASNRKLDEAGELAAKAVELEPLAKNYFLLALIRQRVGDRLAARAAVEKAVSLEPGNPEYRRAYDLIHEGKPE
jgi:Flp pilus assembly protein TadD